MIPTGPFTGLLVVDLTRVLAGPFCTMLLAELGARVVKVENPSGGDDSRAFDPFVGGRSAYFLSLNRGKESVALDLKAPADRELFRIQDFIIDYEMGGLSGYFYNRLPDLTGIRAAVAAMRRHGMSELAALLDEAAGLFAGYTDPDPPSTWAEVCRRYDPAGRLDELGRRIGALDGYGLG